MVFSFATVIVAAAAIFAGSANLAGGRGRAFVSGIHAALYLATGRPSCAPGPDPVPASSRGTDASALSSSWRRWEHLFFKTATERAAW
jgi:hypothetical protein